jgi:hypothetical protein
VERLLAAKLAPSMQLTAALGAQLTRIPHSAPEARHFALLL